MVIENKTKISQDSIEGAMRASNFDNNRYKRFKLVYNLFGLLFGMMLVRGLVQNAMGSEEADTFMTAFYGVATAIFLYIGMVGMDKNNKRRFHSIYGKMKGITFTYLIDSDEIKVTDEEDDSDLFVWADIIKWNEDKENYYLFVSQENCLIIAKDSFTNGNDKDFKELISAVFGLRNQETEKADI